MKVQAATNHAAERPIREERESPAPRRPAAHHLMGDLMQEANDP